MQNSYSNTKKAWFKRKQIIAIIAVLLISGASLALYLLLKKDSSAPRVQPSVSVQTEETTPEPDKIRLTATGDMLPHSTVTANAKSGNSYDYRQFFTQVEPILKKADINFCNQEAPSAGSLPITGYPAFNAPPKFSEDLSAIGCNMISLANNHSFDKGQAGINGTLDSWESQKTLAMTGINRNQEQQNKISYFEVKGIKFSFLSYTICSNIGGAPSYSVNMLNKALTDKQLPEARKNSDIVIVSTHWCKEDVSVEDATQNEWAKYFAEQGTDIVIGTGPHFLQPVRNLPKAGGGETIVWFSLGNFLSTQEQVNGLIGGIAVMDIDVATKKVSTVGFMPTYMHYEWTAAQKAAGDLLARRNLMLYPLDKAADAMAKSQNGTTVEAQADRVTKLMNSYTTIPILKSDHL